MKSLIVILGVVGFVSFSWSSVPKNQLSFPPYLKSLSGGISQEAFNSIPKQIEKIYSPVISRLGGKLSVNKRWEFMSVNAFAFRHENNWTVELSGGLARHPLMTEDAYALAVCHELGHLLGGAPKDKKPVKKMYSNEGQADYFAVTKCLRLYFEDQDNAKVLKQKKVPEILRSSCRKSFRRTDEQNICIRIGLAGIENGKFFASIEKSNEPSLDTPDQIEVSETTDPHPKAQCRLDTYLQGAICDKSPTEDFSDDDETVGACHLLNGDKIGFRPRCWFKPRAL